MIFCILFFTLFCCSTFTLLLLWRIVAIALLLLLWVVSSLHNQHINYLKMLSVIYAVELQAEKLHHKVLQIR